MATTNHATEAGEAAAGPDGEQVEAEGVEADPTE